MFITKLKLKKSLIKKNKKSFGRNNTGKITVAYRKSGHKRLYRQINFNKSLKTNGIIIGIEYDPNRSAFISKIMKKAKNKTQNKFYYEIANEQSNVFFQIKKIKPELKPNSLYNFGKTFHIKNLNIGDFISNIEKWPNRGAIFARSAGSYAQILDVMENNKNNLVKIQLPSKEHYYIFGGSKVTLGQVCNKFHKHLSKWKAGVSSRMGKCSRTRGVAKNPVDHPHGGGEGKTSTGRPPVTPKGLLTKGVPTRKKKKNSFFLALNRKKNI